MRLGGAHFGTPMTVNEVVVVIADEANIRPVAVATEPNRDYLPREQPGLVVP